MAKIKIAYSGTAWGRDNLVQFLDEITAAGFSGIELPGEVAAFQYDKLYLFRQMLAERVLRLESMQGHFLLDDPAKQDDEISFNKMVAEFLASCGADALILSGGLKSPEASGEYGIGRLADACNEIGSYARLLGVKACYRPCPGTAVEKEEEIARLLELTEPALVHLCPDTGHLTRAGIDPVAILRRFASRIAFVHFKDVNAGEDADKFPYCEPGRGRVDFPAILEVLREIDYEGWATVELEKCRTSPKESAGIARLYFEETLGLSLSIIGSALRAPEPVQPPQIPEPAAAVEAPPTAPPAEESAPPPAEAAARVGEAAPVEPPAASQVEPTAVVEQPQPAPAEEVEDFGAGILGEKTTLEHEEATPAEAEAPQQQAPPPEPPAPQPDVQREEKPAPEKPAEGEEKPREEEKHTDEQTGTGG